MQLTEHWPWLYVTEEMPDSAAVMLTFAAQSTRFVSLSSVAAHELTELLICAVCSSVQHAGLKLLWLHLWTTFVNTA